MDMIRSLGSVARWVLGAAVCLALAAGPRPLEQVTLQLKWHHQFQFAGYYAAQAKGYYQAAGLDVTILEAEPGMDVAQEVASGRAQFGVGNSSLLLARNRGLPVVVLGVVFQHSPLELMARADAGISTVQDLVGKRIMIEPMSDELVAYLRKEGIEEDSLKLVRHSFDPQDLVEGRVDCISAYSTDEPFFMKSTHREILEFSPRMGGIDFYGDNLFTSQAELRDHHARVKAFFEASMKGWKYAMAHPEEIIDLILQRYGERRGRAYLRFEAQRMVPLVQPGQVDMGYMYAGRWQHIVDTYAELGLLPGDFPLQGFLYDPEARQRQDYQRLVLTTTALVVLGGLLAAVAAVFLRLNLRLKKEMAHREEADGERRRLEDQLHHDQRMRSLGLLAGGVAHDMNNVLGAILGFAESNLEDPFLGARARRAFETIAKAAVQGGETVKSLLSFARAAPAQERVLDLNVLLREQAQLLAHSTLSRVRLRTDLDPGLRPILGDASTLANAIMNLCVNAVDAMPEQGTLTLRTRSLDSGHVEVEVQDTGCGMTPEVLAQATEPFFTTKAGGKGTGLGLSTVYGVVEAHRGALEIRSVVGEGTTVILRFPVLAGSPPPAPEQPSGAGKASLASLRVLVVDDDPLFLASVRESMENLGATFALAERGDAALAEVKEGFRPDLVLLDVNMPGMDGLETCRRLRELMPGVPVVVTTGRPDADVQAFLKATPGVSLMPKPFRLRDLEVQLAAIL